VAIFILLKRHFSSDGDQCRLKDNREPLREFGTPLEVSHDHLLVTPPSHFTPQKVSGFVDGLTGLRNGTITFPKILLISGTVKGEIASVRCPYFLAKIDDFHLK